VIDASHVPMPATRIAIVGAGFGRYALAPAFRRVGCCEIVAICTRSAESAARAGAELGIERVYTDVEAMLDAGEIDAVAIASPPHVQPTIATLVLSRSLPVFAEKLLALSVDDARVLTAAADRAGVANMVDYIFPELDTWRRARSMISDGDIGTPRHMTVSWMMESYDNRHGLTTWKTDADAGGGALRHFGPHVLHYVEWFMGPIQRLSATLGRAPDAQRPGDTSALLSLEFASGASGSICLSTAAPLGMGHRIEIYGSAGAILLANAQQDPVLGFRLSAGARGENQMREVQHESQPEPLGRIDSRVVPVSRLAERFVSWVRSGNQASPAFGEGLRVQLLLDAAQRSNASGSRVLVSTG
jgi:predicted dehydrogenase